LREKSVKSLEGYKIFRDGTFLAAVTGLEFIDSDAPYGTNNYCVRAVYDFCESQDACVDVSLYVGIADIDLQEVKVYPTPATDVVNIEPTANISHLLVINSLGFTVYSGDITGKKMVRINTTGFMAGSYLLRFFTTEGNTFTKKIVIMK